LDAGDGAVGVEVPLLVALAVAGPDVDFGAVGGAVAVGVEAVGGAVDGEGELSGGGVGPVLVGLAVAVVDLLLGAAGGGGVRVVQALARTHRVQRTTRTAGATATAGAAGTVPGCDDVGLDGGFGGGGGVAGGHDAFGEGAVDAVAVVAADAEDDRALLVHRVVARDVRAGATVVGGEAAGLGVAAEDGPLVGAALDHRGGVPVVRRRVVRVVALVQAGEQAVLHVRHDPRAVARAVAPDLDAAEVDGLHRAVAIVVVVGLGVAVVEAAAAVVVLAVEDRVLGLGVVAGGDAVGGVVAVAGARDDRDAVGLVT